MKWVSTKKARPRAESAAGLLDLSAVASRRADEDKEPSRWHGPTRRLYDARRPMSTIATAPTIGARHGKYSTCEN
jgi:hypothetical protein